MQKGDFMVFMNNRAGTSLPSNKSGVETLVSLNNNKISGAETSVSLNTMLKDETKVSIPKKNYNGTKVPAPIGRFA